jgi:serine/threonine-protein kinase
MTDGHTSRLESALAGRYEIRRKLGEGGMATVYLAQDVKHNRLVAIKVLKPELAAVVGAERFLAEIETTANLQHPHILPLFDSGEADSFLFYVMPYIEGETLADRIAREKQLPVDEALGIATSVCNALQVAHDAGIVHRDIKPGNILLSRGEPLVADFGIALAVGAGGSRLTETGLSVGTPFYMSPEQATGDQRIGPSADIYALACVLYEMLVGEPPYLGNTAQAVLGKIIQGIPVSATSARKTVPANVDAAIRKALEKLPADRFTQAADFGAALSDPSFRHGADALAAGAAGDASRWRMLAFAAAAAAVVSFAAGAAGMLGSRAEPAAVERHRLEFPSLGPTHFWGGSLALAPDGSGMVYLDETESGDEALFYKARGDEDGTFLPGTEGARDPTFNPDGSWVAFRQGGRLVKRPVRGGAPVTLVAEGVDRGFSGIHWMRDGRVLFELDEGDRLARIAEDGGGAVDTLGDVGAMRWLRGIEGADYALVVGCGGGCNLGLADFATREVEYILDGVDRAWYLESGHIVYVRNDGAVFAAPFDVETRQLGALGIPLFEGVRTTGGAANMVLGDDGTMVYVRGASADAAGDREYLVWVDRQGAFEPVDPEWAPEDMSGATLSPDDTRAAVGILGDLPEIWVKELPAGPLTRISDPAYSSTSPVQWTPDGRSLVYARFGQGVSEIVRIRADGSQSEPEVLLSSAAPIGLPSLTPSGEGIVYATLSRPRDIGFADGATDTVALILRRGFSETAPLLSPDGRWLAYVSDVTGEQEVFVRPFPNVEDSRVQISVGGGTEPVWSRDGRELFYKSGSMLLAAAVEADSVLVVTSRTELFAWGGDYIARREARSYDVSLDGGRFLMARNAEAPGLQEAAETPKATLVLVQNWLTELTRMLVEGD